MGFKPFTSKGNAKEEAELEVSEAELSDEEGYFEAEPVEPVCAGDEPEVEDMIMPELIPEEQLPQVPSDDTDFIMEARREAVNHPSHYTCENPQLEVIEVIVAYDMNFAVGNALKYILRAGKKDDELQDLSKASWYVAYEMQKRTTHSEFEFINAPGVEEIAEAYNLSYQRSKAVDFILQYCITGDVTKLTIANEALSKECSRITKNN